MHAVARESSFIVDYGKRLSAAFFVCDPAKSLTRLTIARVATFYGATRVLRTHQFSMRTDKDGSMMSYLERSRRGDPGRQAWLLAVNRKLSNASRAVERSSFFRSPTS